jgi:hypothetical protein
MSEPKILLDIFILIFRKLVSTDDLKVFLAF